MECKFSTEYKFSRIVAIKIYPEWNVNMDSEDKEFIRDLIKIYPEWNVNVCSNLKMRRDSFD